MTPKVKSQYHKVSEKEKSKNELYYCSKIQRKANFPKKLIAQINSHITNVHNMNR